MTKMMFNPSCEETYEGRQTDPVALRLPIEVDETATSYTSRLAALNGSQYVQDFCLDMALSWKQIVSGDAAAISGLAQVSAIDFNTLNESAVQLIGPRRYRFMGATISCMTLRRTRQFVCPMCLRDDISKNGKNGFYGRAHWQLASVRSCHRHKVALTELPLAKYPRSKNDFSGRVRDHWQMALKADPVPGSVTQFERYLTGCLYSISSDSWLDTLDFDVVVHLCESLGILLCFGRCARLSDLSESELAKAGQKGFAACRVGSDGLMAALHEIKAKSDSQRPSYHNDFGMFLRWLVRFCGDERLASIGSVVRGFIFANYPIGTGELVLGVRCQQRVLHSCTSAAKEYGINQSRLYRAAQTLIKRDRIKVPNVSSLWFPVQQYDPFFKALASGLTRIEVARRLGLKPDVVDQLKALGLIAPVLQLDGLADLFPGEQVDGLLAQSLKGAKDTIETGQAWDSLTTTSHSAKCSVADIIKLLSEGKLVHVGQVEGAVGFAAVRVVWREVSMSFAQPRPEGHTQLELRTVLRINDPTVALLIKEGLLRAEKSAHHINRRMRSLVSQQAIDDFLDKYVTLGMLAQQEGIQANHVRARLDRLGIYPLDFPKRFSKIYPRDQTVDLVAGFMSQPAPGVAGSVV